MGEEIHWALFLIIGLIIVIIFIVPLALFDKFKNPFENIGKEGGIDPTTIEGIKDLLNIKKEELNEKIRDNEISAGEAIVSAAVKYVGCAYAARNPSADMRKCNLPPNGACPIDGCEFQCGDLVKKAMYDAGLWKNPTGTPMSAGDLIGPGKQVCSPQRVSANKYDISPQTITINGNEVASIQNYESQLKRGDLFSITYNGCDGCSDAGHTGIYIGDGKIVHAYGTVKTQDMSDFFKSIKDKVQSVTFCTVQA